MSTSASISIAPVVALVLALVLAPVRVLAHELALVRVPVLA